MVDRIISKNRLVCFFRRVIETQGDVTIDLAVTDDKSRGRSKSRRLAGEISKSTLNVNMLCLIFIFGGLLIMMGQHDRSEALFYYFRLEDQVPETHLLRLIEKHISFAFVREELKASYSDTGRPSLDPELLLRILLIGYLYGITSERKLVEELRMHLAWRWFTGLGFDQEIPHHSTFSKNRHGRFQESKLFEQLFEQIVKQCVEVGLVQGQHLSVDGSFVEANAAKESRIPRQQLAEAAQVNQTVRQYLVELEQQNPTEEPVHQQDQVSTTDPDATYATKGGTPARLGYYDNYLVDNHSCVIVGVQATAARMSQETVAAQDMLARFAQWQGREPESVAADTTYGNGEFLQWLADRSVTPYMRTRESIHRKRSPFFGPERFTYEPENNRANKAGRRLEQRNLRDTQLLDWYYSIPHWHTAVYPLNAEATPVEYPPVIVPRLLIPPTKLEVAPGTLTFLTAPFAK